MGIRNTVVALFVLVTPIVSVRAQRPDSLCTYSRCGLSIVPRLAGLDVVRGDGEARAGSLAFLWPRDVSAAFASDAVAHAFAVRATSRRRFAAVMTDAGAVVAAAGVLRMLGDGGRVRGAPSFVALGGFALLGASLPVHFAADADLSRAVWRFNAAFTR